MAMLSATKITGTVVWLGVVRDRQASLCSDARERVDASYAGFEGECHSGLVRASCSRVTGQYPVGTEIRNVRQITILSREDLAGIASAMGIEAIDPSWLGANMVLEGLPDLTLLPPSSRLLFSGGASLVVDMENGPCQWPAREIEKHHPGKGAGFKPAARNLRGVTAWVEREGAISLGDVAVLHVPPLRVYPPLARG
jgi:hypothetical protein